jgi:hypothetical protein
MVCSTVLILLGVSAMVFNRVNQQKQGRDSNVLNQQGTAHE